MLNYANIYSLCMSLSFSLIHHIYTSFLLIRTAWERNQDMGKMTKSGERPKQRQRKGLWSPEEDQKLKSFILSQGHACWTTVPILAGFLFFISEIFD